jgi:hypothetical protein
MLLLLLSILVKPAEAGELLSVSKRTIYELIATVDDFKDAVVHIPGVRGTFLRRDLLERAIERLSPGEVKS